MPLQFAFLIIGKAKASQLNVETFEADLKRSISAQQSIIEKGYKIDVSNISSNDLNWPATTIKLDKSETSQVHTIEFSYQSESLDFYFRVYEFGSNNKCVIKPGEITERVIVVSRQRIKTNYSCSDNEVENASQEIFLIKTKEGKKFVEDVLLNHSFTNISLKGLELPFDLRGLKQKWSNSNTPL